MAPGGDGIVDNATTNNVVEHQQEKEGDCKFSSASSVAPTTTPTRIPAVTPIAPSVYAAGIPSTRILTPAAAQAALEDAWEARAFAEDLQASSNGAAHQWPPRSYTCSFCARQFRTAQALGGHMNVHRRERAQANQANQLNTLRQAADVHGGNGLPTSGSLGTASGSSGTAVAASPHIWLYQVPSLPANSNLSNVFHANTTVMSTQPQGDRNAYPQSHPFPHFQAVKHSYPFPESHIFAQQSQSHLSHMLPLDQQSSLPSSSPFPLPSETSGQAFPPPTQLLWPLADHPRPQAEYKPEVVASEYYTANAKPKPSSPPAQSASNCPYSPNSPLSSPRPSQSSSSTSGLSPSDSVNVVGTLSCCDLKSREILVNYVIKKCESPDPAAGPRPELMRGFQPYSNNLAVGVAGAKAENMTRCSYSQGSHSQSSDDGKRRRLAWRRRIEEHDIDTGEQSSNPGTEPLDLELHL